MANIWQCIQRTADPSKQRLQYNDSIRVSECIFVYIAVTYKDVGNCQLLFDRMNQLLVDAGIPWPHRGTWQRVFANRWEGARKSDAAVSAFAPAYKHARAAR